MNCPKCGIEIPDQNPRYCRGCGAKLTRSSSVRWALGIFIGLSVLMMVTNLIRPKQASQPQVTIAKAQPEKKSAAAAPEARPDPPGVGERGRLNIEAAVALTDRAYSDLTKAAVAKDQIGFLEIFARGEAILVEKDTPVQVIDMGFASRKVRVLAGPHFGKAGWVPYERVSR